MKSPILKSIVNRQAMTALLLVSVLACRADASDVIQWRTDYNTARKEATEKGRPIFLDVGTEECFHCKRLDSSTFRDPLIVAMINQRFIPLKIDGNAEPNLVQALRINAYPTLIVATADGKIVSMIEGYMEATRLMEHLNRGLNHATPDVMARDYQEATRAIGAGDYAKALTLLRGITEDGKDRPVQQKSREMIKELEQQASSRLVRAKQMHDAGQSLEASDALTDLLKRFPGTKAANDGAELLTSISDQPKIRDGIRNRRAQELLAMARDDFKAERYLSCLDQCEVLSNSYRDLPEGSEGLQLAGEIKGNPDRMAKVCEMMNDRLANMYMVQAEAWMKKGDASQARLCLERAMKSSPSSQMVQTAQSRIMQMEGKTTQQTDFKKVP